MRYGDGPAAGAEADCTMSYSGAALRRGPAVSHAEAQPAGGCHSLTEQAALTDSAVPRLPA